MTSASHATLQDAPLLRTKLYIPHVRPESVLRPRLVERLDAGLSRKLTLACAPAGFGKTTLLSEWVHSHSRSAPAPGFCWFSMDKEDNDPIRFLSYLIASLQTIEPSIGESVYVALESSSLSASRRGQGGERGSGDVVENALATLINQISAVGHSFVLILDDYQAVHTRPIHDAVASLVEHLPPNMHLVIATRADPPLPLARWRGRGDLHELRQGDLRFTQQETFEFLNLAMQLDLAPEQTAALAARTEGWIAGLQMAAISMQGAADRERFVHALTGSHRFILDYLTEEVLEGQPTAVQEFLLQTSILDRLSGPLCDAICETLEPGEGQAMLSRLEEQNLFIVPLDDERRWYRYHHLFADLLQQRLQRTYPDRVPILHGRASTWHKEHGLIRVAIDHSLAAGALQWAAELIEQAAEASMLRSEMATLQRWLDTLPEDIVRSRPLLCMYRALSLLLGGHPFDTAERWLQRAIEGDPEGNLTGEVMVFRALLASYQGDLEQSRTLSERALSLLPPRRLFFRSFVTGFLGLVYLYAGDVAAAAPVFREAVRVGQQAGNVTITVLALCHLAELAQIQGQLGAAQSLYEQALEWATDERQRRRPIAGLALMGLGQILRERNKLEEAAQIVGEGIERIAQWSRAGAISGYVTLARVRQAQGDEPSARAAMQTAQQIAAEFDAMQTDDLYVAANKARLLLSQGDIEGVERWADERGLAQEAVLQILENALEGTAVTFMQAADYLVLIELAMARERPHQALQIVDLLLKLADLGQWHAVALKLQVLKALAWQMLGEPERAMDALERALILGQHERPVRMWIDEGPAVVPLLREAARRGIALEYVRTLLAELDSEAKTMPGAPLPSVTFPSQRPLVEPLSDRELEVLRLLATYLSSTEIADELIISANTVRTHIKSIYQKLDVHSRAEAVERAQALGIL